MWNITKKHLGELGIGWGGGLCPGRFQGRGSARWYKTLSPSREILGEVSYPLWPKVVLLRQYRHTEIKLSLYPDLFHLETLQQQPTGACLRKRFWGKHRSVPPMPRPDVGGTACAHPAPERKPAPGKKHSTTAASVQPSAKGARVDRFEQPSSTGSRGLGAPAAAPASARPWRGPAHTARVAQQQLPARKKPQGTASWHGWVHSAQPAAMNTDGS